MADVIEYVSGGTRVRIEGLRDVIKTLQKTAEAAESMRELMHTLGMIVVTASKPRTPVKTGRLRNSIRAGRGKTKAVVRAGGAGIPYAGVIHYGWPLRHYRPSPFLVEALGQNHERIYDQLETGINKIIQDNNLS